MSTDDSFFEVQLEQAEEDALVADLLDKQARLRQRLAALHARLDALDADHAGGRLTDDQVEHDLKAIDEKLAAAESAVEEAKAK